MNEWKKVFNNNVSLYVQIIKKYLLNNGWASICLNDYIKIMPTFQVKDAVFSKDYKKEGAYPIVSQSKDLISGYYDDKLLLNQISNPIIIFGDHTQVVKYIDFDFILGADGTKILTVSEDYNPKFFYYLIKSINLHSNKYARHYSKLRKEFILFHKESLQIQLSIVSFLDSLENNCISEKYFFDEKTESEIISLQKDFYSISSIEIEIEKQKSLVKQLRQNILQDAIEGKLTEEWRKNNPVVKGNPDFDAEALFEKIQEGKRHTDSKKKEKSLPEITEDEKPFEIPKGWKWVRLGEICSKIGSGSTPKGSDYCSLGIPFFRSQNVYNEGLEYKDIVFISESTHKKMKGTAVCPNDLLLNITGGSLGRCAVVSEKFDRGNVSQHVCIVRPIIIKSLYLHIFILSELFQNNIKTSGAGRQGLPKYNLEKMLLPLPPLAEQTEIVRVVESQLAKVDQLEKQIAERETLTKQLIQSIMKDAFGEE